MKYTFQHYLDISTSADSLTLIQFNAGGEYTLRRIKHLLGAFKYIKYGKISIKLLPASTLPVDPLGLGYGDTDPQTVDPRDQMNPGLVRITNGEDIFKNLSTLNDSQMENLYINTMLDPRWSKFMLQSGFKRSAVPLYWNVGQLAQDPYPGSVRNIPGTTNQSSQIQFNGTVHGTTAIQQFDYDYQSADSSWKSILATAYNRDFSDPRGLFQTGHRGRMGWMPTDAFYNVTVPSNTNDNLYAADHDTPMYMPLPEVQCITCLLPKAHKTIYYYRCFITETVYLSGLKNTGINDPDSNTEGRAIDNFVYVPFPTPASPVDFKTATFPDPEPPNDGGGQ